MLFDFLYKYYNIPANFQDFFSKDKIMVFIKTISDRLYEQAQRSIIYPALENTFAAFRITDIRCVILGMDPYAQPEGAAIGLCFSIPRNATYINPSFRSIQTEVANNGFSVNKSSGDISYWIDEGVFLLNSALTVEKNNSGSHISIWSGFTEALLEYLSSQYSLAWLLWGSDAQSYESSILNKERHFIFKCSHPQPLAAYKSFRGNPPFINGSCFNKVNEWLSTQGKKKINWTIR